MLPGFEDLTPHLKPTEVFIVEHYIVPALKRKIGEENGVTNKQMREGMFKTLGIKIDDVKMRKYIQHIRINNLIPKLCSSYKGQFIAQTDQEWNKWKQSMYKRIREQTYTLKCAEHFND